MFHCSVFLMFFRIYFTQFWLWKGTHFIQVFCFWYVLYLSLMEQVNKRCQIKVIFNSCITTAVSSSIIHICQVSCFFLYPLVPRIESLKNNFVSFLNRLFLDAIASQDLGYKSFFYLFCLIVFVIILYFSLLLY